MKLGIVLLLSLLGPAIALGQTTQPTTQPSGKSLSADQMLGQLLKPDPTAAKPLQPVSEKPVQDKSSGGAAVKPNAPPVNVLREGSFLVDRVGRLTRTEGGQAELTFDSDGKALKDPPIFIVPNLKLMQMEDAVTGNGRDLRFRVTGMLTEYRGRNYILLEKVLVVPDSTQQF